MPHDMRMQEAPLKSTGSIVHDQRTGLSRDVESVPAANWTSACVLTGHASRRMYNYSRPGEEGLYLYRISRLRRHGLDRRGPGDLAAGWRTSVTMFTA